MSGKQFGEHSHEHRDNPEPRKIVWHDWRDQLAPTMSHHQHECDNECRHALPITPPPYYTAHAPQNTAYLQAAYPYNAGPHVGAHPDLHHLYGSSYQHQSSYEAHSYRQPFLDQGHLHHGQQQSHVANSDYRQPSPDISHLHRGQESPQFANSAAAYPQHSSQQLLPCPSDQSDHEQASSSLGHDHRQQPHSSSKSIASSWSPPNKSHPQPIQSTPSVTTYPFLSIQRPPATLSHSGNERFARLSQLDLPTRQGSRSGRAFGYQEKSLAAKSTAAESTEAESTEAESTEAESTAAKSTAAKSTAAKPTAAKPTAAKPTAAKSTAVSGVVKKPKDSRLLLFDRQPNASASQSSHSSLQSLCQRSERTQTIYDRVDAVSGVVIPSKLAPGERPKVPPTLADVDTPLTMDCPLCKGRFAKRDHVRSHFPACVTRNGNPDGVRWDDGLPIHKGYPRKSRYRIREDVDGTSSIGEIQKSSRRGEQRSRSRSPL